MSRNGSGRSSYSYKTEEDFKDEILDLKRELTRMKEESKVLKVKLRRSEENAARKEKIICTMIDPMKAHLSAKSARAQNKVIFTSQKRGSLFYPPSLSKVYCEGICSRAYRHNLNHTGGIPSDHNTISTTYLSTNRKKKGNSKVTTSLESATDDSSHNSSKLDLFLYGKQSKAPTDSYQVTVESGSKIKDRTFSDNKKRREGITSSTHKRNSDAKARKEKVTSKKKKSEKNLSSPSYEPYPSSESSSSPSLIDEDTLETQRKIKRGICVGHSSKIHHDYVSCKQCNSKTLKIQENEIESMAACSIENLILEGKKLLSTWDDNKRDNANGQEDEKNEKDNISEVPIGGLLKQCGYNKFGMYLINEHDEADEIESNDKVVAENGYNTHENWRDTNKSKPAPSHTRERRASIFRVDIKKKEPKVENNYLEEIDSSREIGSGEERFILENGMSVSVGRNADELALSDQDFSNVGRSLDDTIVEKNEKSIRVMGHLMESLSVGEQMKKNQAEVSGVESSNFQVNDETNPLEALGKITYVESESVNENKSERHDPTNICNLYCRNVNCCRTFLSSEVPNKIENLLHKANNFPMHEDFFAVHSCQRNVGEEAILLNIISQSNDASTIIHTG